MTDLSPTDRSDAVIQPRQRQRVAFRHILGDIERVGHDLLSQGTHLGRRRLHGLQRQSVRSGKRAAVHRPLVPTIALRIIDIDSDAEMLSIASAAYAVLFLRLGPAGQPLDDQDMQLIPSGFPRPGSFAPMPVRQRSLEIPDDFAVIRNDRVRFQLRDRIIDDGLRKPGLTGDKVAWIWIVGDPKQPIIFLDQLDLVSGSGLAIEDLIYGDQEIGGAARHAPIVADTGPGARTVEGNKTRRQVWPGLC